MALETEISTRFAVHTWTIGILAVLVVAVLGMLFGLQQQLGDIRQQLGQIDGQLAVITNHVVLK